MFGIDDAIGAGGAVLGGLFNLFGGNPKQKYLDASQKYYDQVNPTITSQNVGDIQGTAFNQVDPSTRAAMMGALNTLQDKYRSGGMDAIDRAKSAELMNDQTQTTRQNSAAIMDRARHNGTLNSGRQLVGQLVGAQGAGATASKGAVNLAAAAEQARMEALRGTVGTAKAIQQGDFTKANANDALSRFNKGLQVGNAERNQQAQEQSVGNALNRAQGVGNLAKDGAASNPAGDFVGAVGTAGAGVAKKNGWNFGGGPETHASGGDFNWDEFGGF